MVIQKDYEHVKSTHLNGYLRKLVLKADLVTGLMRFLPFEAIEEAAVTEDALVLTKKELRIVTELEELSKTRGQISKTTICRKLKNFSDAVLKIGITVVTDYVTALNTDIDGFNIVAIKHSLNTFPVITGAITGL
jgi:two-component system, NarL family, sensor histidine kinase EvgS